MDLSRHFRGFTILFKGSKMVLESFPEVFRVSIEFSRLKKVFLESFLFGVSFQVGQATGGFGLKRPFNGEPGLLENHRKTTGNP